MTPACSSSAQSEDSHLRILLGKTATHMPCYRKHNQAYSIVVMEVRSAHMPRENLAVGLVLQL